MDAANTDDAQVKTPDSSGVRWSGRLAAVWGLLGVTALLGQALWRLTPIALDAIRSMTEPLPWAVLISWTLMNAYAEGYRGFHRRFSPRVIARAAHLARYPSLGRAVFAPFFCMSLFGASSRGVRVARGVSGGIVLLVLLVRRLEQPWRGVIDAGVVVGLGIGLLSIGFHGIRALAGSPPAIDADLPAGDALFGGSGQDAGCMSACHVLTILAVEDLPRLVAFYDAAFGWYKAVDVPVYVEFSLDGGMRLGLYDRRGFGQNIGGLPERISPGSTGPTELYFHVEDLPSAISRMEQAGGRLLSPRSQRPWGDEAAYFADPEGNVLVLARPGLGG